MKGVAQKLLLILSRLEDNKEILGTDSLVKMDSEKTDLDSDFLLELKEGTTTSWRKFKLENVPSLRHLIQI